MRTDVPRITPGDHTVFGETDGLEERSVSPLGKDAPPSQGRHAYEPHWVPFEYQSHIR